MAAYHLAQCNIGRLLAPLESEQLKGFVEALDPINALADELNCPVPVARRQRYGVGHPCKRSFEKPL